jgi:hypothetical protein
MVGCRWHPDLAWVRRYVWEGFIRGGGELTGQGSGRCGPPHPQQTMEVGGVSLTAQQQPAAWSFL